MKITVKTLIALLATTICLILILNFVSDTAIQSNFSKIEQDQVLETVQSTQVAVQNIFTHMDEDLQSWCQLNSTYEFIQDKNTEYNDTYLTVNSLSKINVNFVIFLNKGGEFVTGMGLNLTTMQQMSIPADILAQASSNPLIWNLTSLDSDTYGFIMTAEGPLMIDARPILMTNGEGPARGVLVFARYFDSSELSDLSAVVNYYHMSIQPIAAWEEANHVNAADLSGSYIKPLNQQSIVGYNIIDNINNKPIFVIGATIPRTVYDEGLSTISYIDQVLLVAGAVFSLLIVILLEFSVLRKLRKLSNNVIKLGASGEKAKELPISGNDEITWLTLSINGFLKEIQEQTQKIQKAERLSAIGELARQIGHDLRNPLSSMKNAAYYLKVKGDKCSKQSREQMLNVIEADIARSDKIICDLIEYSSDIYLELEECNPKALIADCLLDLKVPSGIQVVDNTSSSIKFQADKQKIERVFKLIVSNAFDAMPNGGKLEVRSIQEGEYVKIEFADTGEGIAEDILPKIFSPLLTTKAQGMGFSLAICKRIVDSHSGKISVESAVDRGTTFKLTLPVKPEISLENQKALMSKPDPLLHYKTPTEFAIQPTKPTE